MVYAYLCTKCEHFASRHLMVDGGTISDGPYRCTQFGCEITQSTPLTPLNKAQTDDIRRCEGAE